MASDDMEGVDMAIANRWGPRPSGTLAGRRERETRPVPRADRMASSTRAVKDRQLNLKVTARFYDRVAALARNRGMSMPAFIEWCVEQSELKP